MQYLIKLNDLPAGRLHFIAGKGAAVGNDETSRIIKALLEEVLSKEIHPVLQKLYRGQLDNRRVFRM